MAPESISTTQFLSPYAHGSSIFPDDLSDGSVTREHSTDGSLAGSIEVPGRDQATINILPDDVLLEIYDFYRAFPNYTTRWRWWWKTLADVCQRWRHIIFALPHGLNLQLECTDKTPTRTSLDIWPQFPIAIYCNSLELGDEGQDNIIAALEHHDRIIGIMIQNQKCIALEKLAVATQKPFPVLEFLRLSSTDDIAPVLHEEFLGGSAPRLRTFSLQHIAFPAFPRPALSATHLSDLTLRDIPITGYISPEAMATCLATLPSLEWLRIEFRSPRSRPDRIRLPPPTRAVLPALFQFNFKGVSEYLEDFIARIDTPKLFWLDIDLFMDLMFHIPRLRQFMARSAETLGPYNSASVTFFATNIHISLGHVKLQISCREPDWQASSMAQVCNQLSPLTSQVTSLDINEDTPGQARQGNGIDPTEWFELFNSFPAVQYLYIYHGLRPLVARALQELTGERATEVLPTLRNLDFKGPSLPGSIREEIQTFIAARQDLNHPFDVHWSDGTRY
ncbi:hypothetical protein BJV74DRAFT_954238 [Russula compacta]|nr:hypothetical protein BJV74DRAFT_954238 [Russula compacta]